MKEVRGAFPRFLKSLARNVPDPYKTAFKMAAEEIEELRSLAELCEDNGQMSNDNGNQRDKKAANLAGVRKAISNDKHKFQP